MQNEVDTSTETINAEFDAAATAIGVETEAEQEQEQALQASQDAMLEAEREAQILMAQQMINTSLRLTLNMFVGVSIDSKQTEEAAHAYAVVIIKYFPGGIFGLLDRYKEELTAATATFMLAKLISQAKAEAEEERQQEEAAKKPEKPASPTGAFTFSEPTGE